MPSGAPLKERIFDLLLERWMLTSMPMHVRELQRDLGRSRPCIEVTLCAMRRMGSVLKCGPGLYEPMPGKRPTGARPTGARRGRKPMPKMGSIGDALLQCAKSK